MSKPRQANKIKSIENTVPIVTDIIFTYFFILVEFVKSESPHLDRWKLQYEHTVKQLALVVGWLCGRSVDRADRRTGAKTIKIIQVIHTIGMI